MPRELFWLTTFKGRDKKKINRQKRHFPRKIAQKEALFKRVCDTERERENVLNIKGIFRFKF